MEAEFSLIDVFSDRPFGGNQLAVFPRAEGLSDEVMQQLAREFQLRREHVRAALVRPCVHSPGPDLEEGIGPVTVIADGPAWRLVLPSPEYETSPQPPIVYSYRFVAIHRISCLVS